MTDNRLSNDELRKLQLSCNKYKTNFERTLCYLENSETLGFMKSEKNAEEENERDSKIFDKATKASSLDEAFRIVDAERKAGEARAATLREKRLLKKLGKKQFEPIISNEEQFEQELELIHSMSSLELVFKAIDRHKKRSKRK